VTRIRLGTYSMEGSSRSRATTACIAAGRRGAFQAQRPGGRAGCGPAAASSWRSPADARRDPRWYRSVRRPHPSRHLTITRSVDYPVPRPGRNPAPSGAPRAQRSGTHSQTLMQ
jgi:hypothetical protein